MIDSYLEGQILKNIYTVRLYDLKIFLKWHSTSSDALGLYGVFHIIYSTLLHIQASHLS